MISFKALKFATSIGGKVKQPPKINFGQPTPNKMFSFGEKVSPEVKQVCSMGQKSASTRVGAKFDGCFKSTSRFDSPQEKLEDITKICNEFKNSTGITLHCPTQWNLAPLDQALMTVANLKHAGTFPSDIKHLIVGHGTGSSINGTWRFCETGENIFSYIRRTIPTGEKVLLGVCEEGTTVVGKPGIGRHVVNSFIDSSMPGKIVESGKNEIIGHFLTNNESTLSSITYYNRLNKIF